MLLVGCGSGSMPSTTAPARPRSARAAVIDRDADTVLDADQCPDDAEDLDGFQDGDGCYDGDDDGDGRVDADDLCPRHAEDMDSFENEDGCPDPDNDQDRIADMEDRCPNEPETYNGRDDEDGCPDRALVVLNTPAPTPRERVFFASRSARVPVVMEPILDMVAATLQHNPQIERVALVGRSATGENPRVAAQRAIAVRDALVARGVDASRLEPLSLAAQATLGDKALDRSVELFVRRVDGRDHDDQLLRSAQAVP